MRFRSVKKEEPTLGIAPLIDIVFLLLIFFMVTSHFDVASGVRIRLPQVAKMIYDQHENKVTVVIDKSGGLASRQGCQTRRRGADHGYCKKSGCSFHCHCGPLEIG